MNTIYYTYNEKLYAILLNIEVSESYNNHQ